MALRPLAALVAAASALSIAAPARAATLNVNTTQDVVEATGCTAVLCTLRSALGVATTNGTAEIDTIVLPAGMYALNGQLPGLDVPAGQTGIVITGAGANSTTIQASSAVRVLTIGGEVTLRDLTLSGGEVTSGVGGNVSVLGGAAATLERVRVTGGTAQQGGGVAATAGSGTTTLTIRQSLIDANNASGTALTAAGGGLYVFGATFPVTVTVTDTTIAGNFARNGAGVAIANNGLAPPSFRGVTLARNIARAGTGGIGVGGIYSGSATVNFQGSIVAGNLTTVNTGSAPVQAPANCAITPAATDQGGNLETGTDCGLAGHQNTDPQLAPALDTSQPPALAIPATSPAVDIAACGGRTLDQRGVTRPQLGGCDAGAYEYQPPPPEPTPAPTPVVPVPTATATPVPTPVAGRSVGVQPSGRVLVKLPGSRAFVPLGDGVLPNGAQVDTRDGSVVITRTDGGRARFFDGIFRISHSRGITTLTLTQALARCSSKARAAQKRKPKTRRLWGDGKGKFRTKGRYSAATVRGTKWLVTDGCRYTRTRVTRGSVLVRDTVRKRNIVVRKGKSYVARPRR